MTTENTNEAKVEFTLKLLSDGNVRVVQEEHEVDIRAMLSEALQIANLKDLEKTLNGFETIVLRAPEDEIQVTARSTTRCCWKPVNGRMVYVCPC